MPPELLQFLLSQQLQSQGQPSAQSVPLGPEFGTNPGFPDPFTRPSFAERAPQPPPFGGASDLGFLGPQPGGIPLPTAPAGFGQPSPEPVPFNLAPTFGSQQQQQQGPDEGGRGFFDTLGDVGSGFAEGIARARLGGGGGGGAVPGTGGAASFPGTGSSLGGGLPGVSGTAGSALGQVGREQQADVMQQRQLAADLLGSLIGGVGGAVGGLGGGGGGGPEAPPAAGPAPAAPGRAPLATPPRRQIIRS